MVAYAPDPRLTQTELADLLEQAGMFVAYSYQQVEVELIRLVAKYARRGLTAPITLTERLQSIQELHREADRIVARIKEPEIAARAIAVGAQEGEAAAVRQLGYLTGIAPSVAASTTVPATAAAAVAQISLSLTNSLTDMRQRITRWAPDAYRNVIALYSTSTLSGAATIDESRKRAVQQFLSQGITGFTDSAGRDWRIGSYAEMAGRTTVKRAWQESNISRLTEPGTDIRLGTIIGGVGVCKFCAPWIGTVVSLDGTPAGSYRLEHATEDRFVQVSVKGSIDDARRAGWDHPNAVLEGSTYASYDETREMSRSRYTGPAVSIRTRLGQTTIGSNHPVMTQRGLVKAKLLRESDQLVYDRRAVEGSSMSVEHNLQDVPLVEDVFQTYASLGGLARVPSTGNDLHGDAVFGNGEIEVVLPEDGLLSVLDPGTPQMFREFNFTGADVQSETLARLRAKDPTAEWIYLSATGSVGGFGPHANYLLVPIESKMTVQYDGWAYDASTGGSLYCSDGIVVANCRCTCVGYLPGLQLPQGETTYDPKAEKDRDRLRALERRVRSWKRREAASLDDIESARARRKVKESQAAIRKHVQDTGVMRDNRREQLAFSDGDLPRVRPRAVR